MYHQTDGPAIVWSESGKEWCINGKRHRLNGPAYEDWNGDKEWWINGCLHRLDGPAIALKNSYSHRWYIKNKSYSKSCHNRLYLFSILEPRRFVLNPAEDY